MTKKKHTYHCWMRVIKADGGTNVPGDSANPSGDYQICSGPRPPKVTSRDTANRPLKMVDSWYADAEYNADPSADVIFDYGPAYVKRENALNWLNGADGMAWVGEALTYQLFCFELEE
jgi:hypothetical protein